MNPQGIVLRTISEDGNVGILARYKRLRQLYQEARAMGTKSHLSQVCLPVTTSTSADHLFVLCHCRADVHGYLLPRV